MRFVPVLLVAGLLAGGALAAEGDPQRRPVPADMAKARSIVLKRADLGRGWKRDTTPTTADDEFSCSYYNPDESDLVETGRAEGNFQAQVVFVLSEASIYRTAAQAEASWARTVRPQLARCFAEKLAEETRREGSPTRVVRAGALAFPRLAPKTAAWRIVLRITQSGNTVPVTVDLIALGRGRMLAALGLIQFGAAPPAAAERQLAGLIARRMR